MVGSDDGRAHPRLALVCLGIWLNAADSLVTATIMPSVARDIGGYALFAWPVAVYLVGSVVAGACAGRLSEQTGLRMALMLAAGLYAVGCAAGALAAAMPLFLFGRLLQGAGAGMIVGLCYASASAFFPGDIWRRALATLSGVWGIATILGPLLGGIFAESWRVLFWLFAAQAAVFAIAAWFLVSRAPPSASRVAVPVRTLVLLAASVLFCLLAGTSASTARAALAFVCGVACLVAMVRRDAFSAVRLLPRDIGARGSRAGQGYAAIFLFNAAAVGFSVYGAAILQAGYGLSPLTAGYTIAAEALSWTLAALVVSEFPPQADRRVIRAGATLNVAAILALIAAMPSGVLAEVVVVALMLGTSFGAMWAFLSRRIVDHLPVAERGVGAAAIPSVQMVGNAFGPRWPVWSPMAWARATGSTGSTRGSSPPGCSWPPHRWRLGPGLSLGRRRARRDNRSLARSAEGHSAAQSAQTAISTVTWLRPG